MKRRTALLLFICAILFTLVQNQLNMTTPPCLNSQYFCQDQQNHCIPNEWICDNLRDCDNGKDESSCNYPIDCPDGHLMCKNVVCVASKLKCDGFDDCSDGSDELGCPEKSVLHIIHTTCPETMFQCVRGPCVYLGALCDGRKDCPENDDEKPCDDIDIAINQDCDQETHFKCEFDGNCVPHSWTCDGMDDCSDGSDEHFCNDDGRIPSLLGYLQLHVTSGDSTQMLSTCGQDQFTCSGNDELKCIPKSRLCDQNRDCPSGDDEGGLCGQCDTFQCQYECVDNPLGPTCACPPGLILDMNSKSCVDQDECLPSLSGQLLCAHYCHNIIGSYTCSCAFGYELNDDGHTCRLSRFQDDNQGRLLEMPSMVSDLLPVRMMSLSDRTTPDVSYEDVFENEHLGGIIKGLDYDNSANDRLYMSVSSVGGRLGSIHEYHGQRQKCLFDRVVGISNVAIDWITANVYYTAGSQPESSPSPRPGVGVCSSNNRYCRLLLGDEQMHRFHGLVIHPRRGLMFWSDWGEIRPKIEQASMDGTDRTTLIDDKLDWPNGLTMDYIGEQLYFSDAQLQTIEKVDIFTGRRSLVTTQGVHHPYDLVVFDGHVYWTDWNIEAVVVTSLLNVSDRHIVHSLPQVPYGLTIDHKAYHMQTKNLPNPCTSSTCSHLCLLTSDLSDGHPKSVCACPDRYTANDWGQCVPFNDTQIDLLASIQTPRMCLSLMEDYCRRDTACFNGGYCKVNSSINGKILAISCECPPEFGGLYCEIALRIDSASSEVFNRFVAFSILILSSLAFIWCSYRLCSISTNANLVHKNPIRELGTHVQYLRSRSSRNLLEKQPILSEATRSVSPQSGRQTLKQTDSFSNPLYERNDSSPYMPTTVTNDSTVDQVSEQVYSTTPKCDNDSGLGSGFIVVNV